LRNDRITPPGRVIAIQFPRPEERRDPDQKQATARVMTLADLDRVMKVLEGGANGTIRTA
jgi:hypothetical protein